MTLLNPGPRHPEILFRFIRNIGVAGNLTTDAHLAALCIEHQARLASTDADFSRFAGLRWLTPLFNLLLTGSRSRTALMRQSLTFA